MGIDSFTEVTTQSWGSRLKDSLFGIIFGLILIVGSVILLFWNEGRAVKRAQALEEGASAVVSVSSNEVDPVNEGKLIHLSGTTSTTDVLADTLFPVTETAIRLNRRVKMYQWEESKQTKTKEELGGKKKTITTYSYSRDWSSTPINSSSFKKPEGHQNPGSFPYTEQHQAATHVQVDAFSLSPSQISSLSGGKTIELPADFVARLPESMRARAVVKDNELYLGADPASPQIGDMRISFSWVEPGQVVSIIAKQNGSSFVPYVAKSGSSIQLLVQGNQTADAMFTAEKKSNTILTWILRFVGFLLMFIGFRTTFNIARTLAAVVPFLAKIVGFGLSMISGLLALILTLLTVAVAWFFYRPLLSIFLVVVVIAIIVGFRFMKKSSKQEAFIPPPPPA